MANAWDADVALSPEVAARLVETQVPVLRPVSLRPLGVGWDNDAYLVNGAFVFRFPRRRVAAGLLETEMRALSLLAGHLPLPVPRPVFTGHPADGYPYPFAGYALLPGRTADSVDLDDADRARAAPVLGRFLRALHDTAIPEGVPGDLLGRTDLRRRAEMIEEKLARFGAFEGAASVLAAARELAAARPHPGPPVLAHGDLYARHLLVDDAHALCGVIDWGDVHAGDPALDLSVAFSFLPAAARPALLDAYGPLDADALARARFKALFYGAALLEYGRARGDAALVRTARTALHYALP